MMVLSVIFTLMIATVLKFKLKIAAATFSGGKKYVEIMVEFKHWGNFWKTVEIP